MGKRDGHFYVKVGVTLLLVLVFVLTGCAEKSIISNKSFESLHYEVKECVEQVDIGLGIEVIEEKIQIIHVMETNCCFDVELSYKKTDETLRIYEDFSGDECDCICNKEITAEIEGKDIIEIEFYSRLNTEYPYELLLEKDIWNYFLIVKYLAKFAIFDISSTIEIN